MKTIFHILYDPATRRYYTLRPDDPDKPLHEITLGAVVDLDRTMVRYEVDGYNNNHGI